MTSHDAHPVVRAHRGGCSCWFGGKGSTHSVTRSGMGTGQPAADPCVDETLHRGSSLLMNGPQTVLEETDFGWSLGLVGEDRSVKTKPVSL